MFGPSGSTLIVDCLTDNLNRSVSDLRAVVNKCHIKMGSVGSVSYNYDNLCIVGFKGANEEEVINALIENDIDVEDIEMQDDMVVIYGNPQDLFKIKDAITSSFKNIEFEIDEISKLPKEKVTLQGEDLETFKKVLTLLDDVEDVKQVYHNVEL